ncbi:MAG: GDSL-type esterase/lipase family protein [Armatimonadota bacterium]|nr:GDSL-type esterase/lipase family protein [Armatimonadota bacterium]
MFKTNSQLKQLKVPALLGYAAVVAAGLFSGLSQANAAAAESATTAAPSSEPPKLPTLFVVGDSTARNNANGAQGWGDPFVSYFDPAKIRVLNGAMAGRSSRTFIAEGRWDKVLEEMKAGDFVLIQLGHNDGGPIDTGRARASLPGTGEETKEATMPSGNKEVVHTYGWYLRKMIVDTKAKGATPIVLSLTVRNIWKDGKIERGSGRYGQWAAEVAQSQGVQFIDVTNIIADHYEKMGQEKVKEMFGPDYVHTSPAGADLNAASVVLGLKRINHPLVNYLSDKGKAVADSTATAASPTTEGTQPSTATPQTAPPQGAPPDNTNPTPPTRRPLPVPADPALPSLFLIGDSTVRNGQGDGSNGQWGWGEPLAGYFDQMKINVVNRAVGGLSSRTYLTGGFWEATKAMIKPGDFVIMQFGHNDPGPLNDESRARGTIRGAGEEIEEIDNLLTKQHEVVHTYGWYLRKYIADTKVKGATPIVCSPVPRKGWTDGKVNRNAGTYGGWAAAAATSEKVPFINLNEIIARKYDALGPEKVEPLFADRNTHTSLAGAELNAACVIAGLKALKENPLAPYFSAKATEVPPADAETVANNTATTGPTTGGTATGGTATKTGFKFDFGSGKIEPGYVAVLPSTVYSEELGYGFEPGVDIVAVDRGGPDALRGDFCTSDKPFFFSVAVPEGNYNVTVILGDQAGETTTTLKAEARRLLLEKAQTARGQFETRTFTVAVKRPTLKSGDTVRLKAAEQGHRDWDDRLTLEFNNTRPCVCALEVTPASDAATVYIAGDSTVTNQRSEPWAAWGQMLPRFFKPGVAISNHAESGESLRSFISEKRLEKILDTIKAGDYLFIQFGHNDQKDKSPGAGPFTTYKENLKRFVTEAQNKGAIPVLVTSMERRRFDGTKPLPTLADFAEAVRQVGKEENVPVIDLNSVSLKLYEALGPEDTKKAFVHYAAGTFPGQDKPLKDDTHFNPYGAYELARCIVEGIKANVPELAKFLVDDVPAFDPGHPDPVATWTLPASPAITVVKPEGS